MWIIIILIPIFIILNSIYEHRNFDLTKYDIYSEKYTKDVENISFVVLSDLHNNGFSDKCNKLIKNIKTLNPDYILIAGDMIIKNKSLDAWDNAIRLIGELSKEYKIYYAYGNHEQNENIFNHKVFNEFKTYLTSLGVVFLDNNKVALDDKVHIYGLNISLDYFYKKINLNKEDIDKLIGKSDKKFFNILLAHNPDFFHEYADWGADITISGHLHGGIMQIPYFGGVLSPKFKLFPKYSSGMFKHKTKTMIVSRGLGTHTIKIRIFNKPELIVLNLKTMEDNNGNSS